MTRTNLGVFVVVAALSAACSSKDKEPPAPPITYQALPTPESEAPDRAPTAAEVPVAEDFDEESEAQINAENFRAELDRLEAEINADSVP